MMSETHGRQQTRSYLDRVKHYQNLDPTAKRLLDFSKATHSYNCRLAVVEFRTGGVTKTEFTDVERLKDYWQANAASDDCKGRLFLLEDLSVSYLAAFGDHFNVDPSFFISHLYVPRWTKNQSERYTARLPPKLFSSRAVSQSTFSLRYYEQRNTTSREWTVENPFEETTCANIARSVLTIKPQYGNLCLSILRNASFWVSDRSSPCWNAIILVDPPFGDKITQRSREDPRASKIVVPISTEMQLQPYSALSIWPQQSCPNPPPEAIISSQRSLFDAILFYWAHESDTDDINAAISNPYLSFAPAERLVASFWTVQLEFMTGIVSQLESELWGFESLASQPQLFADKIKDEISVLRNVLSSVNRWRRRVWWYLNDTKLNIEALKHPHSRGKSGPSERSWNSALSGEELVRMDFSNINEQLQYCKDRVESLMPVVMGAFSLLEAQQNTLESKYVTRLTVLALVFVPLSFTTGLFSMSETYLPGRSGFGVFCAVSLPLVLLVFLSVFATRHIHVRWRQKRASKKRVE